MNLAAHLRISRHTLWFSRRTLRILRHTLRISRRNEWSPGAPCESCSTPCESGGTFSENHWSRLEKGWGRDPSSIFKSLSYSLLPLFNERDTGSKFSNSKTTNCLDEVVWSFITGTELAKGSQKISWSPYYLKLGCFLAVDLKMGSVDLERIWEKGSYSNLQYLCEYRESFLLVRPQWQDNFFIEEQSFSFLMFNKAEKTGKLFRFF